MRSRPIRRHPLLAMATVLVACSGLGSTHLVITGTMTIQAAVRTG